LENDKFLKPFQNRKFSLGTVKFGKMVCVGELMKYFNEIAYIADKVKLVCGMSFPKHT
jgi:hypothetical protein